MKKTNNSAHGSGNGSGDGLPQQETLRWRRETSDLPIWTGLIVITFLALMLGFHYWRLLDEQLQQQPIQGVPLYSRPAQLQTDQSISADRLEEELQFLGYRQERDDLVDWFEAVEDGVLFQHRDGNGRPRRYRVRIAEGKIESILHEGSAVDSVWLRTRYLGDLSGQGTDRRRYVRYDELSPILIQAILAAEDERFHYHHGVDLIALFRAARTNIQERAMVQGGSTVTQQLVKNYLLTPERTFRRKLEEAVLATIVEIRFSKRQILEMYANEVYLGQHGPHAIIGMGEAAYLYFDKSVGELKVSEAALLAGMIRAPNRYHPQRNPEETRQRRDQVIDLMLKKGFIEENEWRQALHESLPEPKGEVQSFLDAAHFIDYVRRWLQGIDFKPRPGMQLYTTLEPHLQGAALESVQRGLAQIDRTLERRRHRQGPAEAALVALDPKTGEILALVGGRDYLASQFNRATEAQRQPGSAFKPFVYAAGLASRSITLASLIADEPTNFVFGDEEYSPGNYGDRYRGRVSVRQSLALSLNVPTVRIAERIGYRAVSSFAAQAAFDRDFPPYPSLALGTIELTPLELVQAYTVFANPGKLARANPVRAVSQGDWISEVMLPPPAQTTDPAAAWLVTSALQTALDRGTAASARGRGFRLPAAGKTGTTRDSWFVGFTPDLVVVVWVGIDQGSLNIEGSRAALPIWTDFMNKAHRLGFLSGEGFPRPANVTAIRIDATTGQRAGPWCSETRTEYFLAGSEPAACSQWNHLREFPQHEESEDLVRSRTQLPPEMEAQLSRSHRPERRDESRESGEPNRESRPGEAQHRDRDTERREEGNRRPLPSPD